jgi:hypothetical protein
VLVGKEVLRSAFFCARRPKKPQLVLKIVYCKLLFCNGLVFR